MPWSDTFCLDTSYKNRQFNEDLFHHRDTKGERENGTTTSAQFRFRFANHVAENEGPSTSRAWRSRICSDTNLEERHAKTPKRGSIAGFLSDLRVFSDAFKNYRFRVHSVTFC
jgi:hypothetical protein